MAHDMSENEQLMYKKLFDLMGARVRIACSSDRTVYQGIITSIIPGLRSVRLRHTTFINGDYLGNIRFRFKEISSLSVIESSEVVNRYPKNEYLLDILKNKTKKKYDINDLLFDGQLSDHSDDEETEDEKSEDQEFALELPPHLRNVLPNVFCVIDYVDINFTQAVQNISKEGVIGVSFSGPQVSRFGKLTSVCISTASHVYLFDIERLKNEAFDSGLRGIFEDASIKKVIHDCRFPSDCLAHQYATQLTNVFDTQVADFIISMQRYNDKYKFKYVTSLDCCLSNHLDIPPEFVYKYTVGLKDTERNEFYTKRPISNEFKYFLMKNALYLILLHKTLARKLLDPLHKNVNVYLRILANASQQEIDILGNDISPPDCIPPAILMNSIQTAKFKRLQKKKSVSLECKFIDPKTKQIIIPEKALYSESAAQKKCLSTKSLKKISSEVDKENHMLQKVARHHKSDLNALTVESSASPVEDSSKTIITVKPSLRHMDEVYHKLVNNLNLRSHHSESVINVKPDECYVSKFTFRMPFSDSSSSNSNTSKELNVNTAAENSSGDFWASLWSSSDEPTVTLKEKYKNIHFVPA